MRRLLRLQKPSVFLRTASVPASSCVQSNFSSHTPCQQPLLRPSRSHWSNRASAVRHYASDAKPPQTDEQQAAEALVAEREVAELDLVEDELAAEQSAATRLRPAAEPTLVLPPKVRMAPRPNDVEDASYMPAESGAQLEEVGGLADYWENSDHWDVGKEIRTFGLPQRIREREVLEVMVRRAIIEALAVQSQEPSAQDNGLSLTSSWALGSSQQRNDALSLQLKVAEDGSASLAGGVSSVLSGLSVDNAAENVEEPLSAGEAQELVQSWDQSWKNISLQDTALKFAVSKRILQLTGHAISDAKLSTIRNMRDVLAILIKPPKAKKLAEEIHTRGQLSQLSNVAVYDRRVTPIDKHKMVGRWKVITQELEKRDLPVTGTGGHSKSVEAKWFDFRVVKPKPKKNAS